MKVGILTFHRAYNYGATLQAYALQEKLQGMGIESEIIDYLNEDLEKQDKLFTYSSKLGIKGNLVKLIKDCYRRGKNTAFDQFTKEKICTSPKRYSSFDELIQMDQQSPYDAYIVGSDQVWNPKNTLNDPAFLLSFVSDDEKKCSYAASLGSAKFDDEMYAQYQKEIEKFRVLSVREESVVGQYGFLKENNAKAVVDPTLLLTKDTYEAIASPRILKKKYAFMYTIAGERNLREFARRYCKENGLILVDSKKSPVFFRNASPRDFLSFIQNAECVFTNSFHGTALSIVMEKQFITEVHTKTSLNNRSNDLMKKLDLQDRDIDSDAFASRKAIDYGRVNAILAELRSDSVDVLKQIVEK